MREMNSPKGDSPSENSPTPRPQEKKDLIWIPDGTEQGAAASGCRGRWKPCSGYGYAKPPWQSRRGSREPASLHVAIWRRRASPALRFAMSVEHRVIHMEVRQQGRNHLARPREDRIPCCVGQSAPPTRPVPRANYNRTFAPVASASFSGKSSSIRPSQALHGAEGSCQKLRDAPCSATSMDWPRKGTSILCD